MALKYEHIAKVCHEANKSFCESIGDSSQESWVSCPEWQRESALAGVKLHIENSDLGDDASHKAWMDHKIKEGWVYGPIKDAEKKEHPCLVPFEELPLYQQLKDGLFRSIVHSLKGGC